MDFFTGLIESNINVVLVILGALLLFSMFFDVIFGNQIRQGARRSAAITGTILITIGIGLSIIGDTSRTEAEKRNDQLQATITSMGTIVPLELQTAEVKGRQTAIAETSISSTLPQTSTISIKDIISDTKTYTTSSSTTLDEGITTTTDISLSNYSTSFAITTVESGELAYNMEYKFPRDRIYHSARLVFFITKNNRDMSEFDTLELIIQFNQGKNKGLVCLADGNDFPCVCIGGDCIYNDQDIEMTRKGNQQIYQVPLRSEFDSLDTSSIESVHFVISNQEGSEINDGSFSVIDVKFLK